MSVDGYQSLAAAVLQQAHRDTMRAPRHADSGVTQHDLGARIDALRFLMFASEDLDFWCAVAGIDAQAVMRTAWREHGTELSALEERQRELTRKAIEAARRAAAGAPVRRAARGRPRRRLIGWTAEPHEPTA